MAGDVRAEGDWIEPFRLQRASPSKTRLESHCLQCYPPHMGITLWRTGEWLLINRAGQREKRRRAVYGIVESRRKTVDKYAASRDNCRGEANYVWTG